MNYRPLGLLAEVTHACPLHCPYCSNPLVVQGPVLELSVSLWGDAIRQAAELGVLQCSFSGGEPLLFSGLDRLIQAAQQEGVYTNLITSGVGLNAARALRLKESGLDNVQIQGYVLCGLGDLIAGAKVHAKKIEAAKNVTLAGLNLSLNVVLHRFSVDHMDALANLAGDLGATRIELAHIQFYGWAYENRRLLLPTRDQIRRADDEIGAIRERYRGSVEVLYVKSDYFDARPKACMGGWGQKLLTIDPYGYVLPCPTARSIPDMDFANVREAPLATIWAESEAFQRFRGEAWMREPCRSCEFRTVDYGGCRCQAALITGDAANTDPVCGFSNRRGELDELFDKSIGNTIAKSRYRTAPTT